ncbi:hypothetical protein FACS1894120_2070 [Clostridia bacterium]|nr:hypothetical protein FACS1894120_2070 [Clostridia bacterium]
MMKSYRGRGFMSVNDIGFFRAEDQGELELILKDLRKPEHFLMYTYDREFGFNFHESYFPRDSEREKQARLYFKRNQDLAPEGLV